MTATGPLAGLTVIVARDDAPDDDVSCAIAAAGAVVLPLPLMKIEADIDIDVAVDGYDIVAFTSRHAVAAVVARGIACPRGCIAAVGPSTAQALVDAGWRVDIVGTGGGRELAALLPVTTSTRVLWPRAAEANAGLREAVVARGAVVVEVVVYRSVPIADRESVARAFAHPRPLAIVLTSPARVATLLTFGPVAVDVAVVVVGDTTAKACSDAGLAVAAVAASPGADPLCAALQTLQTLR